jgi:hypothetical protein
MFIGARAPFIALYLVVSASGYLPHYTHKEKQVLQSAAMQVSANTVEVTTEQYDQMLEKKIADIKKMARCLKSGRCMVPIYRRALSAAFLSQHLGAPLQAYGIEAPEILVSQSSTEFYRPR